jgi:hypothetical protein
MNRFKRIALGTGILVLMTSTTAIAQGKGGGNKPQGGGAPKTAQATKPTQSPKVQSPKVQTAKSQAPVKASGSTKTVAQGKPTKTAPATQSAKNTKATTTTTTKGPKAARTETASAKTTKSATASVSASASTSTTTTPAGTGTQPVVLTPVQQKLQKNTNLASKLQSRLPAGTDLMKASAGFKNLGQFVAAVNVSNNLGIPFRQLKTKMVDDGMSLGQSIKTLRPESSSTVEANRAEYDARGMILESETTTVSATVSASTTTSTTTPTTTTQPKKGKRQGNGSHE